MNSYYRELTKYKHFYNTIIIKVKIKNTEVTGT